MTVETLRVQTRNFKDLRVWQRAIILNKMTYSATSAFPKEELYGLTSQMRRSAVSVASNIAEGSKRNTKGEFIQFLGIAQGSLAELETQIIIAAEIGFIINETLTSLEEEIDAIGKMLLQLKRSLQNNDKL